MASWKFVRAVVAIVAVGVLVGCGTSSTPNGGDPLASVEAALVPGAALFVVGNTSLNSGDSAISQRLQALGFTVVLKGDAASTAADATGKSVVVVSSTVTSGNVGSKFKSVAVPVLLWESSLLDDMGMVASGALGIAANQTRAKIVVASSDPMAAGLSGVQTVVSGSSTFSWGVPASQATVVAQLDADATKSALFRYETGSTMVGLSAPERRVAVFLENTTASLLNAPGRELVDAAIRWAAHVTAGECTPGTTQQCNGSGTQTCSASGTWGQCVGSSCTPGTMRCTANGAQVCTPESIWGALITCG